MKSFKREVMYVLNKFKKDIAPQDTERDDTGKQIVLEALIKNTVGCRAVYCFNHCFNCNEGHIGILMRIRILLIYGSLCCITLYQL